MASVQSVINASIFELSIVKSSSLISQNTGSRPFHTIACVADVKIKSVIIYPPLGKFNVCKDNFNAICSFVNKSSCSTPKYPPISSETLGASLPYSPSSSITKLISL